MLKLKKPDSFDNLCNGQKVQVKGDKSSIYYGHHGTFAGMSTFFGADMAIVNFIDPKPIHWADGKVMDSDIFRLYEIRVEGEAA